MAKKKLISDRDNAIKEKVHLKENIKLMEINQDQINAQLELITQENQTLATQVDDLNQKVNSLFYLLDLQKNLKKKGILKSRFLKGVRLNDVSPDHFIQTLNLSQNDQMVITATDLGVKKIKDVVLYPKYYKKGKSYKVLITPNKKHALLTLTDTAKFKSERVVIAVK